MGSFEKIEESDLTPAMKQYVDIKNKHKEAIVFFRMGDFYETFYDDAIKASEILHITLTSRRQGKSKAPLAGIPFHAADTYIKRLVDTGQKIVVVEQLEDPKQAKKIVKRGVTRIITPGTVIEDNILTPAQNNYLASITIEGNRFGMAVCDVSTSELKMTQSEDTKLILGELEKFRPSELIVTRMFASQTIISKCKTLNITITRLDEEFFEYDTALHIASEQFDTDHIQKLAKHNELAINALGPLITYLKKNLLQDSIHLDFPTVYSLSQTMVLDHTTQQNLEIVINQRDGTTKGTLFSTMNKTMTGMGSRKLKQLLLQPSLDTETITKRQEAIRIFVNNKILLGDVRNTLRSCSDIQRMVSRAAFGTLNPKETVGMARTINTFSKLRELLSQTNSRLLSESVNITNADDLATTIFKTLNEDPATSVREGGIIAKGVNAELDELRDMTTDSKTWLRYFEQREREHTGIKSLKVKYNKVFGYFIEVTKANLHLVPEQYIRKQTQVNSERFITDELKEKESQLLGARERANTLEYNIYMRLIQEVVKGQDELKRIGESIAMIDAIESMAKVADSHSYSQPEMSPDKSLLIQKGRHPVVEQTTSFVANNTVFDVKDTLHIITGPNMAGKSTYLRQVALITLLAHTGSFVPAAQARIPITDRIFTRIGAQDNLSQGESTFMVEMTETANILANATEQSLIILDEIGRGTSTYDGFSIAWAVASHIIRRIKAKSLFATHYHQLNTLADKFDSVKNYHSTVEENEQGLLFLRKILPGSTDKSFGIHVAQIAGLPQEVINEAMKVMDVLENDDHIRNKTTLEKQTTATSKEKQEMNEEDLSYTGQLSLDKFNKKLGR
ncbi:MAG: DNA mismatch repair protein MutS [Nanoarchaeota archaeon]